MATYAGTKIPTVDVLSLTLRIAIFIPRGAPKKCQATGCRSNLSSTYP
jgi:hypothetical protein